MILRALLCLMPSIIDAWLEASAGRKVETFIPVFENQVDRPAEGERVRMQLHVLTLTSLLEEA